MIHHLIMTGEDSDISLKQGILHCHDKKIALSVLGSVQCLSMRVRWSQQALCALSQQCPLIMATWSKQRGKWATSALLPRCRYVNPEVSHLISRLPSKRSTAYASAIIFRKIENQHSLIRALEPDYPALPKLAANSYNRILHLEAKWARFFWAQYFRAASQDLFAREKRQAQAPLNIALNYGYAFLYHAIEWQCVASGIEPGIGIIHRLRRSRPSLVCDLIEPLRCCVEITIMRYLDEMHDKKLMAARFAEMLESTWSYRNKRFRLRSIIRLYVESFAKSILKDTPSLFHPFSLHARDACL